jgi:glucose-1-phosphate adenylyltransferase
VRECSIRDRLVAEGCRITAASIDHSVIGIRSVIGSGATIRDSIVMGGDYYERSEDQAENLRAGLPHIGIGKGVQIERAIIDKNARIGEGAVIRNAEGIQDCDRDGYYIRDGIVVVPKGGVIPSGAEL